MSNHWRPAGDKDVPSLETIKKRLNYNKGKAPLEFVREFEDTLNEFRKAYRRREGEDWSRFHDWGSPAHQAQLAKVTEEFLVKEEHGQRFWPDDPAHPFRNESLIWLWDEERITDLTKQLLYRKVHPRPEIPRHSRKVRKRQEAPVDPAPKAGPPDTVDDDARSTTAAPATMSPPAQAAPGPSEPIPRSQNVSPQPRAPEAVMEAPERQKVKHEIVLRFDRIADGFKEPVMEPSFEPTMETPVTGSAGKTPVPAVVFRYVVYHWRNNSLDGETWPSTSLAGLKEELALHFENSGRTLTFTLVGEHIRWRYHIGATNEDHFANMEREFRRRINQFVIQRGESVGSDPGPLTFDIVIGGNGDRGPV